MARNLSIAALGAWRKHLVPLAGTKSLTYLEIGIYQAGSASWILRNVLTGPEDRYIGIDPWLDDPKAEQIARRTLKPFQEKTTILKGLSADVLRGPQFQPDMFDVAYIDGGPLWLDRLSDSVLVWPLVRSGGIIMWDDYKWGDLQDAIDRFLDLVKGQYELLWKRRTVGIRKVST